MRKLHIWFKYEKWWVFNEKIADLKPLVTNNHRSKTMLWTTLNLHVQAYESTNHYILIMESKSKRKKIMLETDIYMLTWIHNQT